MNRFYADYPERYEWLFAIDEENAVLRCRSNQRKIVYNIHTKSRTNITTNECKMLKEVGYEIKDARAKVWESMKAYK